MSKYTGRAPGVTFEEREEQSNSKPSISNAIGIVGVAIKGPTDLTLLSSEKQAIAIFGKPYQNNSAMTGVLACLKYSKEVYFKRVISENAKVAKSWEAPEERSIDVTKTWSISSTSATLEESLGDTNLDIDTVVITAKDTTNTVDLIVTNGIEKGSYTISAEAEVASVVVDAEAGTITATATDTSDRVVEIKVVAKGKVNKPAFVFKSLDLTQAYNGAKVVIEKVSGSDEKIVYSFYDKSGTELETYQCTLDTTSNLYIGNVINRYSDYLEIETNTEVEPELPATYVLDGGDSGLDATAEDIIGTGSSGMKAFYDPELVDISTLVVPTWADSKVWEEAMKICDYRRDIFYIPSLPIGLNPDQVAALATGTGEFAQEFTPFNSDYVGLYWPNGLMQNPETGLNEVVDIAPFVAATFAYSDSISNVWISPAGLERGKVFGLTGLEYRTTKEERDMLYSDEVNVNSVCLVKGQGIAIMGARTSRIFTLTDTNKALRYISVRRMCNYIRKVVLAESMYSLFEQNDSYTWSAWRMRIDPYLRAIRDSQGLYDYQIIMDETTVTEENIDRGEMPGTIKVAPKKPGEYIDVNFVIAKNGTTSFTEESEA